MWNYLELKLCLYNHHMIASCIKVPFGMVCLSHGFLLLNPYCPNWSHCNLHSNCARKNQQTKTRHEKGLEAPIHNYSQSRVTLELNSQECVFYHHFWQQSSLYWSLVVPLETPDDSNKTEQHRNTKCSKKTSRINKWNKNSFKRFSVKF